MYGNKQKFQNKPINTISSLRNIPYIRPLYILQWCKLQPPNVHHVIFFANRSFMHCRQFFLFFTAEQNTMHPKLLEYKAIKAILHAKAKNRKVVWPKQLRGLQHENRRRTLKDKAKSFTLIGKHLYIQCKFNKTRVQQHVDGKRWI